MAQSLYTTAMAGKPSIHDHGVGPEHVRRLQDHRHRITIVGPGALGGAMARALAAAGYRIDEIVSRSGAASEGRARQLARQTGARSRTLSRTSARPGAQATFGAGLIWICVADDAIAPVARALAARRDVPWRERIVLHASGALSSRLLQPLARRGAAIGSLHPMMSFVRGGPVPDLKNVWFGLEGDAAATHAARSLVRALGGKVVNVRPENKALYHAVGSFASPMIVATLALAEQIARAAGMPRRATAGLIEPILRRTVENYLRGGTVAAFSGPLLRGDLTTVREHLRALRRVPGALEVYRALVRSALPMLPVGNRKEIARLVK